MPVDVDLASLDEAIEKFHNQHEREYTYRRDGAAIEIYQLGLRAIGITPKPELPHYPLSGASVEPEPFTRRPVTFDELDEPVTTPIFQRDALRAGTVIQGPAIIDQFDSTIVVPPGVIAKVDEYLIVRLHLTQDPS